MIFEAVRSDGTASHIYPHHINLAMHERSTKIEQSIEMAMRMMTSVEKGFCELLGTINDTGSFIRSSHLNVAAQSLRGIAYVEEGHLIDRVLAEYQPDRSHTLQVLVAASK